jgi:hypothetical protein
MGKTASCWSARASKRLGTTTASNRWAAFQNDSTSMAACRLRSGFSQAGSVADSRFRNFSSFRGKAASGVVGAAVFPGDLLSLRFRRVVR